MLYLHIAYTRIVVFMTWFYIVSVLNKPLIHHHIIIKLLLLSMQDDECGVYSRESRLCLCCLPPAHGVYSCQHCDRLM
jgi:hypothetical protein